MKRMHRAAHLLLWIPLATCLIALLTLAWVNFEASL